MGIKLLLTLAPLRGLLHLGHPTPFSRALRPRRCWAPRRFLAGPGGFRAALDLLGHLREAAADRGEDDLDPQQIGVLPRQPIAALRPGAVKRASLLAVSFIASPPRRLTRSSGKAFREFRSEF